MVNELVDAAALDLPFMPIEDAAFAANPAAGFAAARAQHPWLARCSVGYVLTENRAMRDMMRHDDQMVMGFNDIVEYMGATGTPWGNFIAGSIQGQSGATHQRLRDALRSAFTPRQASRYRAVMQQEIQRLCDEWLPRGAFDFEEFISYYPITVLCRMIGASPAAIPDLRDSLEALGLAFSMDRANLPRLQHGMGILERFAQDLLASRRAGQRPDDDEPDLLDLLIEARASGGLSEDELVNLMIFLFGGGYDTSKNVLTLMMHQLIDRPDIYEKCAGDLDYCRAVTNETLRFHAPGTATRKPVADIEFRGVRFPAGALIMFPWGMSGRDATAFANPDSFEPGRKGAAGNYAFGLGGHICLGQFIAKVQIEEGLHVIARRLRHPQRNGPHGWRPFPGVWGMAGLPIRCEPAA